MSKPLPIQAVEFTNHLGHVIKPGDKVVAIAQGYNKSLHIREAEYVGCRIGSTYWKKEEHVQSVTVRVNIKGQRWNRETRQYENFEKVRLSTLPSCRIYPLAMPLASLERL